jgi:hypothetical protein
MKHLIKIFFLFLTISLSASTYYVAPTTATPAGSNANAGTLDAPWATFDYSFDQVTAGDTVYFRGGIYYVTSTQARNSLNGTYGNPICFFAYPSDFNAGNPPIIDGINATSYISGIQFQSSSYLHFKGITIRNCFQIDAYVPGEPYDAPRGMYFYYCSNITLTQCTAHNIGYRGFNFLEPDSVYIINCDAYNIADTLSDVAGNHGDGFHLLDMVTDSTVYVYISGCRSWNCSDDGFDVCGTGLYEIENCWSFGHGHYAMYPVGGGSGFKFGYQTSQYYAVKRKFNNCIAIYNKAAGWSTNDSYPFYPMPHEVFNCTSYHNGIGFGILNTAGTNTNELLRVYKNNIAYANTNEVQSVSTAYYTESHNTWDRINDWPPWEYTDTVTVSDLDFLSVDSTGITAARQVDGSLPDNDCYNYFLRLASTSDLINAGVDIGLSYEDSNPDIGAFEFEDLGPVIEPLVIFTTGAYPSKISCSIIGNVYDDGGGTVSARGVVWAETENPDLTDNVVSGGSGVGSYTVTITGLTQGSTYHVRAYATNEIGTEYGNDLEFTTKITSFSKTNGKWVFYNGKWIRI